MLDLWLVRHGETDWNRAGLLQGSSDIPLNELGRRQAATLRERLARRGFDRVVSSDLARAAETARIALPGVEPELDARVQEIGFGEFEGRAWRELPPEDASTAFAWLTGPYHLRPPGGESADDVRERLGEWLAELPSEGRVIAFAHGATIGALVQRFTGRPKPYRWGDPDAGAWGFRFANCSITRLHLSPGFATLHVLNDHAHLEALLEGSD